MSAWVVVPCLLALRDEFNQLNPKRDKGADGTIGDSNHNSSSDHSPDEDSDVLRDHDADHKNEVHALDIDSTGPWPRSFNSIILDIVERERAEYNHPTTKARLKYVIWNRRIASRSNGWAWRAYSESDPHTNHAHFSALYTTSTENDTRSWGVAPTTAKPQEEDVALSAEDKAWIRATIKEGINGPLSDVVPRWSDAGGPVPTTDANPEISVANALFYIGAMGRRNENLAADTRARLISVEQVLVQFGAALAELQSRTGGAPTTAQLVQALREVLRTGVGGA